MKGRKIWSYPWSMTEGWLIMIGLVVSGVLIQSTVGAVPWSLFSWPANIISVGVFSVLAIMLYIMRRTSYFCRWISTSTAAVSALSVSAVLTIVMGLIRQEERGTWLSGILSFWPFVLSYLFMAIILSQICLQRISHFHWRRDIPFLLNHLGLLIVLLTATLGNADMRRVKMITEKGQAEWRVLNEKGEVEELPIAIELDRFIMEEYPTDSISAEGQAGSRAPKRFASEVHVYTKSGVSTTATIDVNKPFEIEGWKIYQYGYDTQMGAMSNISILELVRDPWLTWVYIGIWMMLLGAWSMFIIGMKKR